MTRKDYQIIAGVLKMYYRKNPKIYKGQVMVMAAVLEDNYPKFNREKFLLACGVES